MEFHKVIYELWWWRLIGSQNEATRNEFAISERIEPEGIMQPAAESVTHTTGPTDWITPLTFAQWMRYKPM